MKTTIPLNFKISDGVRAWAERKGHDHLEEHHENFVLTAQAKGYRYVDWDAAFKRAVRDDWAGISKAKTPARGSSNGKKQSHHHEITSIIHGRLRSVE